MENFGLRKSGTILIAIIIAIAGIGLPAPVSGGTVLIHRDHAGDSRYPASRWGEPPSRVAIGHEPDTSRVAVSVGAGRSPAGIMPTHGGPLVPTPEYEMMALKSKGIQEVAIIAGDLGFFPKTVFVTRDIPVRMYVTSSSKQNLCIMMDAFRITRQVQTEKITEISFTPGSPGQYRYYCPINGMEGTLIVKELSL